MALCHFIHAALLGLAWLIVIHLVVLLRRLVWPYIRNGSSLVPQAVVNSVMVTACKYSRQLLIMFMSASEKASGHRILSIICSSYCLCGGGNWSLSSPIFASRSLRNVRRELIHRTFKLARFVLVLVRMGWLIPVASWVHATATRNSLPVWFDVHQNVRNSMIWPVSWCE
jgi:hypothetical protein